MTCYRCGRRDPDALGVCSRCWVRVASKLVASFRRAASCCNALCDGVNHLPNCAILPSAPLHALIKRRCAELGLSRYMLAAVCAPRLGKTVEAARRSLERLVEADRVTVRMFDEWSIALGCHPVEIYPEWAA